MADRTKTIETWTVLRENGFTPGSALEVEAFFAARSEDAATALSSDLEADGWSARSSSTRMLFKKAWVVVATRRQDSVQQGDLDAITEDMRRRAQVHGCEFEGVDGEPLT